MKITTSTTLQEIKNLQTCKQCGRCCNQGSGILLLDQIKKLANHLNTTSANLKKEFLEEVYRFNKKFYRPTLKRKDLPFGKCVFLKDKKCSIQKFKPFECNIATCNEYGDAINQWFNYNYILDKNDEQSVREFKYYLSLRKPIEGIKYD